MRLEWIDDLLAVFDGGSLARAAEKRLLTQSAFTRRVRIIEDSVGATLFDRRRKPITLMPGVQALEPELRDLSARLHKLRHSMKTASDQAGTTTSFVCQHALTTTISPQIVRALTSDSGASVRVRSGNQDECLMHLISKEVDFAIMYALPDEEAFDTGKAFDSVTLGSDVLIPVSAPNLHNNPTDTVIQTISYPPEVFLGRVFARRISPRLPKEITVSPIAETALTLAMLQLVLTQIGMAWLPESLVGEHLSQGRLRRLDDILPAQTLLIKMVRLAEAQTKHTDQTWQYLAQHLNIRPPDQIDPLTPPVRSVSRHIPQPAPAASSN